MPPLNFECCQSIDQERRESKELDKKIKERMRQYKRVIQLLLLGAGESGKTTIIKQMRILHDQKGFTKEEREEKTREIRRNIYEAIKELTDGMIRINPPVTLHNKSNEESLKFIENFDIKSVNHYDFSSIFYENVKRLWEDPGMQICYNRSNEFQLIDSAKYFLDKIDTIKQENYLPNDQDILHSRKRTTNIQKIEFECKIPIQYGGGSQEFWMFDVGGQKGERRKWIQVFDGITAVVFLAACSEFDTKTREDNETNRMTESLALFEDVWHSKYLLGAGFILFLNKQDILKQKIENGIRVEKYFPEYESYKISSKDANVKDANDEYLRSRCFLRDKFIEITKKPADHRKYSTGQLKENGDGKKRKCFHHFTTATDTNNIKKVFNDVHSMIILRNIEEAIPQ